MNYRRVLSGKVSAAVRDVYGGVCQYCGAGGANHVDHIIAKSEGGEDDVRNYILACSGCNVRKGDGAIAPQYLGLITAIADRNKDRVMKRLGERPQKGVRIGWTKELSTFVPLSSPPTRLQLDIMVALNNFWIGVREKMKNAAEPKDAPAHC